MTEIKCNKDYLKRLIEILGASEFRSMTTAGTAPRSVTLRQPILKSTPANPVDVKAVCAKTLAALRELFMRGEEAVNKGVAIPFVRLCRKHKFHEIERTIFALFLENEISARGGCEPGRLNENLFKYLRGLFGATKMELLPYFLSGGRLKESGIFPQEMYSRGDVVRFPSQLRETVIEEVLQSPGKPKAKKRTGKKITGPRQIGERLDLNVIAQANAKRKLSTVAFQHLERMKAHVRQGMATPRLNTLLLGPTGCGKTYITRQLAAILGVPVVFCDATQYTETGYVGSNVEDMLVQLQKTCSDNPKGADYGIIFIDEIDKIAAQNPGGGHNTERDVSGLSVQQELLKMLEGEKLAYEKSRSMGPSAYSFNVKNVLFIAAGAFQGLTDVISERIKTKQPIGFKGPAASVLADLPPADLLRQAKPQDIIKYGFMPELIGRFPNIIALDKLTKEDFLAILGNQRTSLLEHYKVFFAQNGVELEIPPAFLEEMAAKAVSRDLGARGLNSAVENFFAELIYELLDRNAGQAPQKVNIMDCLKDDRLKEFFA